MPTTASGTPRPLSADAKVDRAPLIPCLLLRGGLVCRPGPDGPVVARTGSGATIDPFDLVDRLVGDFPLLYLVDLDGIEKGDPQLDYLQEISRDIAMWVDAGVRSSDQAIDVLVAGANRAVLSSAYLRGPRALARAWKLSTEFVFEIEMHGPSLAPPPGDWGTSDPVELARVVRAAGPDHIVVSPRETEPEWSVIRSIAGGGPTWVDGSFAVEDAPKIAETGAVGGIFHIDGILERWEETKGEVAPVMRTPATRDDET